MTSKTKLTFAESASVNAFAVSKVPANAHIRLKIKPLSLVMFTLFAQSTFLANQVSAEEMLSLKLSQQLSSQPPTNKAATSNANLIVAEASVDKEQATEIRFSASQYGLSNKTLLAAEATDANPVGSSAGAKESAKALSKDKGKNSLPFDKKSADPKAVDIQLKEITVRAKRFYQVGPLPGLGLTKEEIPGNVQSITAKEIKESHALSLTDLMNSKLQSVNVNDYQSNPFQMDVTYRGFTASPQLGTAQGLSVFLDGIRVNEPFGDVVNWDMIPLNAINGLDVFPGSNPIFGLGTLGGAISMRTKSGFDANEGTVEALGGSFNRKQFQGSIGGNNGVIAGFAAANIFSEDGWRDNSPSKVNQVFGKAEWRNESLQLGLSGLYAGNELTGNGLLPTELAQQDRSQVFTSPDVTKNRLLQFQLTGLWDVSDTFNITGQVYKRKSRRNSSTGDVNQNIGGAATRRQLPGERLANGLPDFNGDGLPDLVPENTSINNVAAQTITLLNGQTSETYLDINGNPEITGFINELVLDPDTGLPFLDQDGNQQFNPVAVFNPAFDGYDLVNGGYDPAKLVIGTNANTIALAGQSVDANGRPVWIVNPFPLTAIPAFTPEYYQKVLALWQTRGADFPLMIFENGEQFDAATTNYAYYDKNGFFVGGASTGTITPDSPLQPIGGSNPGINRPLGILAIDSNGNSIQRDGADCQFGFDSPKNRKCAGYIEGTPTALVTETVIDQTTDGAALQLNWNLEKHKFMLGASIDSADASYKSGQMLGLFDDKRNVFLDPSKLGYEFYAADHKINLNDFAGNSSTKSAYFSETWTPTKAWAFTAAGRFNYTKIKNDLAINNILGLVGPTAFKNFYQLDVLCPDSNGNGTLELEECPTGSILPFSPELALGLGSLGKGEVEKFTYRSFNPSLGGTWQPNEALNVYGNWNKGARTPSVIELGCAFDDTPKLIGSNPDGTPLYGPRSLVERRFCSLPSTLAGDPYLKQVRSETMEVGARGYLTPDIQWNAAVYQTDLTDDIYFVSFTPERSFFQNIGNTRRRGLEMGLQGKWNKLGFRLNYSITDATFQEKFTVASPNNSSAGNVPGRVTAYSVDTYQTIPVRPGDRIPGVPLHNLNASLSYDITPDWAIALTGILHSESFVRGNENNKHRAGTSNYIYNCSAASSPTIVNDVLYGNDTCESKVQRPSSRFPGKVPGYAVFNFSTSYKVTKGLTAGLQISNLFNREYYSAGRLGVNPFVAGQYGVQGAGGFNYNSNDWLSSTFLAPGAPRAGFMTLTYDFDIGK